ncbi:uncharacterized protein LOC134544224 isoform X3 [Bacillus rossius redtenbacheri]
MNEELSEILALPLDTVSKEYFETKTTSVLPGVEKKKKKLRPTLLRNFGVSRVSDLTPKKIKLFREVQSKTKALKRLRKKYVAKTQLSHFDKSVSLESDLQFLKLREGISPAAYQLLVSQLRCAKKNPRGRRWTVREKIMYLTILKRSPAAYRLLKQMIVLPCKRTLTSMLNAVPFKCGVDTKVLNVVQEIVASMNENDKYCCLLFDEMSLKENIQYSSSEDRILGYVDDGACRTGELANQAMVFMVRGLRKRWKQPIACFFTRSGMKGPALKQAIQQVLGACLAVGLKVVATVCDMGTNNVSALRGL